MSSSIATPTDPVLATRHADAEGEGATPDGLEGARGIIAGVVLSVPLWIGIVYAVRAVLR